MTPAEMYQTVYSAWVEGRLENVLQRQKELAALHAALQKHRGQLVKSLCQDLASSESSAVEEVNVTLDAIQQLYDDLDFPQSLAQEKAIKSGRSAPINAVPLGPALIQAAPSCPLSSTILPLAAVVAAGSYCIVLPSERANAVNEKLRDVIRESLDQDAIAVAADGSASTAQELSDMSFEVAVLQDPATYDDMAMSLRAANPYIHIRYPSSGLPAIFVDRSTSDLEAVSTIIDETILQNPRISHSRVPRLCFVDEFIIERLDRLIRRTAIAQEPTDSADPSQQRLASLLARTFASFKNRSSLPSSVLGLSSTDTITADTIGRIAHDVTSQFHGILLVPTRSFDHGIDLWNKVNRGVSAQATYVFGHSNEASYFARFLYSNHVFINQIPLRSLVVVSPVSNFNSYPLLFTKHDFSTNKAVIQAPLHATKTQTVKDGVSNREQLRLSRIAQPNGGRLSYFEQGLIVGLAVSLVAVSSFGYVGYWGLKNYWR